MEKRDDFSNPIKVGLLILLAVMGICQTAQAADVRVIASPNAPVDTMDKKMIKSVYLGKKTAWPDGRPIEFVILKSGEVHKDFLKTFVNQTPSQFSTFWKRQVFSGKGSAPKIFSTEIELVTYVSKHDLAVGYVSRSADVTSVKVVNEK